MKFPIGPTISRPGPILFSVAATAVKFVIRSKLSRDTIRTDTAKIRIYNVRKILVDLRTSCVIVLSSILIFLTAFG